MTLEVIGTFAVAFCLIIGAVFTLVGAIGLLKFNDSMTRLHAPTKVGTVGIGMFLLASIVHAFTFGEGSLNEALIMAFLFVTAPISANFMAKVNIHRKSCDPLPDAGQGEIWSTLDVPDDDREIAQDDPARVNQ